MTLFPPLPLSWQDLARRTYQKATEDNFLDLGGATLVLLLSRAVSGHPVPPRPGELFSAAAPDRRHRLDARHRRLPRSVAAHPGSNAAPGQCAEWRVAHIWRARGLVEQFRGVGVHCGRAESRVRHHRGSPVVESAAGGHRPDHRDGSAGAHRAVIGSGRSGARHLPWRHAGMGRLLQVDVAHPPVASGVCDDHHRHRVWSTTLDRTQNRTGPGCHRAPSSGPSSGCSPLSPSRYMWRDSRTTTPPMARSAA